MDIISKDRGNITIEMETIKGYQMEIPDKKIK